MTKPLEHILDKKYPCYFISPHLDDAALSVGCLMRYLVRHGVPVTVINVFTDAPNIRQTMSARKFVNATGYSNPTTLFTARRDEDKTALTRLGIHVINLGFTDAAWRQKKKLSRLVNLIQKYIPELSHVYPIHRIHIASNKISHHDDLLIKEIASSLRSTITEKNFFVFCPEAIGGHVDHAIVNKVVTNMYSAYRWIDQPYAQHQKYLLPKNTSSVKFSVNYHHKKALLRMYQSQISLLFPSGKIPLLDETILYDN